MSPDVRNASRATYGDLSQAFADALRTADPDMQVDACPAWTVHDLLAHQVHQLSGCCDGSFPIVDALDALAAPTAEERAAAGLRQQAWIDRGVTAERRSPVAQLVRQWDELVDTASTHCLEAMLPDAVVHLFDLLGALRLSSHREHPLVLEALDFWAAMADRRIQAAGFAGLRVEIDDGPTLGRTDSGVVIAGSGFEVLRTVAGRRSRSQAGARLRMAGTGAALDHVALYGWRDSPLDE